MRSSLAAVLLAAACLLCMGAADFYTRVPQDHRCFADLRLLSDAGYLNGWTRPDHSMLRLEVAMLLQSELPAYYAAQAEARTAPETDEAARRLTKEFKAELAGLGAQLPGIDAAPGKPASAPAPLAGAPLLKMEDLNPERVGAEQLVIEDEVLSDAQSQARPPRTATGGGDNADASTSIELDALAREQGHVPAAPSTMQAVPLPDNVSPEASADERPAEASPPGAPVWTPAADEPATMLEIAPGAEPEEPASPRPAPDRPASAVAEAPARPATLAPTPTPAATPRPYRTGGGDARDMNLLLDEREGELEHVAWNAESESPGPVGEYQVRDEQLGPPRPYGRNIDVEVQPFIDAQGQFGYRHTDGTAVSGNASDLRLYWADAGVDFMHEDWRAKLAVNFNDRSGEAKLHELWVELRDSDNGLYGRAGRSVLPFADRKGWFPTFGYTRELGFTSANSAGLGWNKPGWGLSAWVYDASVASVGGGSDSLDQLALNLSLMSDEPAGCDTSWRLALAYLSELGGHERSLATGPLAASVPGLNVSAGYTWDGGLWQVALDYTAALDAYDAGALDANGDGAGDQPSALGLELIYSPAGMSFYGLRFESTQQYAGAAGTRWGLLYGQWLSEQMLGRLELSRGTYNAYTPGKRRDVALTADLNLVF